MEAKLEAASQARVIPGAVLFAANKNGTLNYTKAFGYRSLDDSSTAEPLTADSVGWIASCTKLLTSISALQCVERGLITLDEDVRDIVDELKDLEVISSDEEGNIASLTKSTQPITLRQLLTHTSGFAYDFINPLVQKWRSQQPAGEPQTTVRARCTQPLIYEPGTGWSYGPSTDWVGVVVERVTKTNLQDYMAKNIWQPLGIKDMTFFLSTRPDLQARIAHMSWREPGSSDEPCTYSNDQFFQKPDMDQAQGGGGIYASFSECIKVLRAILLASDESASDDAPPPPAQLLRRSTVDTMFTPQLSESCRTQLQETFGNHRSSLFIGGAPPEARKDWGLAGLLVQEDVDGWWRKGTMHWGGLPNLFWWIDRTEGLCGLYAGQLMPLGDEKTVEMWQAFVKDMYKHNSATKGKV